MTSHPAPSRAIALDGPAAAGKSTVGRALARRIGYLFLDTGAIYRALTVAALDAGVDVDDEAALAALAERLAISVEPAPEMPAGYRVRIDGRDVSARLRAAEVDAAVSGVSRHRAVRRALRPAQRRLAEQAPIVMVGRDIGTVVLPDAPLKLFLVASPEERARRRYRERLARGEAVRWQDVLRGVVERDEKDRSRAEDPLRMAEDAVQVDSDGRSVDEVVARMASLVREAGLVAG